MKTSEALWIIMSECVRIGVSFTLEYDNGKRIPGEFVMCSEEEQKQHIRQDPTGWNIDIAGYGNDGLLSNISEAISIGLYILRDVLAEKSETSEVLKQFNL